ncbi:MAG: hypothetical protein LBT17_03800 [Mycoplasmataceae bacterium]|nr:hypothetical protein [Mycoplasmataceae bacterium]
MAELKSTIKQLTPINTDKEIVITALRADRRMVEMHAKRLTELFKNETQQQINMKLQNIIARENVFNAIMEETVRNFETTFDEDELKTLKERLKTQFPQQNENNLTEIAKKVIIKTLIFRELGKQWNISVTDDEINASLEQYYKVSNQSIRDYKENKEKFEGIRNVIFEEKITNELIKKYSNVRIDWETIKKQQEEMIAKQKESAAQQPPTEDSKKTN